MNSANQMSARWKLIAAIQEALQALYQRSTDWNRYLEQSQLESSAVENLLNRSGKPPTNALLLEILPTLPGHISPEELHQIRQRATDYNSTREVVQQLVEQPANDGESNNPDNPPEGANANISDGENEMAGKNTPESEDQQTDRSIAPVPTGSLTLTPPAEPTSHAVDIGQLQTAFEELITALQDQPAGQDIRGERLLAALGLMLSWKKRVNNNFDFYFRGDDLNIQLPGKE